MHPPSRRRLRSASANPSLPPQPPRNKPAPAPGAPGGETLASASVEKPPRPDHGASLANLDTGHHGHIHDSHDGLAAQAERQIRVAQEHQGRPTGERDDDDDDAGAKDGFPDPEKTRQSSRVDKEHGDPMVEEEAGPSHVAEEGKDTGGGSDDHLHDHNDGGDNKGREGDGSLVVVVVEDNENRERVSVPAALAGRISEIETLAEESSSITTSRFRALVTDFQDEYSEARLLAMLSRPVMRYIRAAMSLQGARTLPLPRTKASSDKRTAAARSAGQALPETCQRLCARICMAWDVELETLTAQFPTASSSAILRRLRRFAKAVPSWTDGCKLLQDQVDRRLRRDPGPSASGGRIQTWRGASRDPDITVSDVDMALEAAGIPVPPRKPPQRRRPVIAQPVDGATLGLSSDNEEDVGPDNLAAPEAGAALDDHGTKTRKRLARESPSRKSPRQIVPQAGGDLDLPDEIGEGLQLDEQEYDGLLPANSSISSPASIEVGRHRETSLRLGSVHEDFSSEDDAVDSRVLDNEKRKRRASSPLDAFSPLMSPMHRLSGGSRDLRGSGSQHHSLIDITTPNKRAKTDSGGLGSGSLAVLLHAADSLKPGAWVNDAAINALLQRLVTPSLGVIDSLLVAEVVSARIPSFMESRPLRQFLHQRTEYLLLPYHNGETHWSLYVWSSRERTLEWRDSLGWPPQQQDRVAGFLSWLYEESLDLAPVTYTVATAPRQTNTVDCGIHLIAHAQHVARQLGAGPSSPACAMASFNSEQRRALFSAQLLTSSTLAPDALEPYLGPAPRASSKTSTRPDPLRQHNLPAGSDHIAKPVSAFRESCARCRADVDASGRVLADLHARHSRLLRQALELRQRRRADTDGLDRRVALLNELRALPPLSWQAAAAPSSSSPTPAVLARHTIRAALRSVDEMTDIVHLNVAGACKGEPDGRVPSAMSDVVVSYLIIRAAAASFRRALEQRQFLLDGAQAASSFL